MAKWNTKKISTVCLALYLLISARRTLFGQSLDIPFKKYGISFGNSKEFTGLRFNFRDSEVVSLTGINVTFWSPRKDNEKAVVKGLSLGVIPGGGYLCGVQIGLLGVAAEKSMTGINIGVLGAGCGGSMTGINVGGLGAGAGGDMSGLNFGLLGMGAGKNLNGINIGGLGAGAGENMIGLNIGGVGIGAGHRLTGVNIAGLGAGAGERLSGLTIAGIGAGAPKVLGLTIAGIGIGGETLTGIHLSLGMIKVVNNGRMVGFSASAFNHFKGSQTGIAIGIVNYAYRVNGVQLGLVNIVRDNPKGLKILPVFNTSF